MSEPACTNYLISHGAGVVLYPGGGPRANANGSPIYAPTNVTVDGTVYLSDNDGDGNWPGVQVGDMICLDIDVTRVWRRVVARDVGGYGWKLQIDSVPGFSGSNIKCNVGGAFGSLHWALTNVANTAVFRNTAGNPLAFNVPNDGTWFNEAIDHSAGGAGTSQFPVFVRGFNATPGDIDWTVDTGRAIFRGFVPVLRAAQAANPAVFTTGTIATIGGVSQSPLVITTTATADPAYPPGTPVLFTDNSDTLPAGLAKATLYYARSTGTAKQFWLYDTQAHAIAGGAAGRLATTGGSDAGTHWLDCYHGFGVGQKVNVASCAGGTWATANVNDSIITARTETTFTVGAMNASGFGTYTAQTGTATPFNGATAKTGLVTKPAAYARYQHLDLQTAVASKRCFSWTAATAGGQIENCRLQCVVEAIGGTSGWTNAWCRRNLIEYSGSTTVPAVDLKGISMAGMFENNVVRYAVYDGIWVGGAAHSLSENLVYGCGRDGISRQSTTGQIELAFNTSADNGLNGLQLLSYTTAELVSLVSNIFANNGTSGAATLESNTGGRVTIANVYSKLSNWTAIPVVFTGTGLPAEIVAGQVYFLQFQAQTGADDCRYFIFREASFGTRVANGDGTGTQTASVGFGIAATFTETGHLLGQNDWNLVSRNLAGNQNGASYGGILTNGAAASGAAVVIDHSRHNDYSNPAFTGADKAARIANGYALGSKAKSIRQALADSLFVSLPDVGAMQSASAGGPAGMVVV